METEAYLGPEDAASHAAFRPSSHALFYGVGGHAYVYRIYGIHFCLNAITGRAGTPGCVLIRALEPVAGVATMAARRGFAAPERRGFAAPERRGRPTPAALLTNGPGKLTRALGITARENGADLTDSALVIAPPDAPRDFHVAIGPRVGITRATDRPLRFWIRDSRYVSRA